jgi:ubiquitin thioesterase OTU1
MLADDATVGDLVDQIIEKTAVAHFDIKCGYPPKPLLLQQDQRSNPLSILDIKLNRETLIISPNDGASANAGVTSDKQTPQSTSPAKTTQERKESAPSVSFSGMNSAEPKQKSSKPVSLKKKAMAGEVPELPLPELGATMGKTSIPLCS